MSSLSLYLLFMIHSPSSINSLAGDVLTATSFSCHYAMITVLCRILSFFSLIQPNPPNHHLAAVCFVSHKCHGISPRSSGSRHRLIIILVVVSIMSLIARRLDPAARDDDLSYRVTPSISDAIAFLSSEPRGELVTFLATLPNAPPVGHGFARHHCTSLTRHSTTNERTHASVSPTEFSSCTSLAREGSSAIFLPVVQAAVGEIPLVDAPIKSAFGGLLAVF
ncbi:hypothetical protein EV702DRAFT_61684 [Suillus placidus]|uniref:Uncharacterized protein n=1 Tax=Suillus placidus TaxID=48579 RepID=A0A9P7CX81_9AGAM|nr:hypothetical protein EV702DRAFT_61684 [Suillus placidus]